MASETLGRARRGDIAVLEIRAHDGIPTRWEIHRVTSITREGVVKATVDPWPNSAPVPYARLFAARCHIASAATVDADAVMAAARAHHWPGHPDHPMSFDTFEAARDVVKAHRRVTP
jgi:hypothetical protein